MTAEECTPQLRWLIRTELVSTSAAVKVYGRKEVLQQLWKVTEMVPMVSQTGGPSWQRYSVREEWRDVPMVIET